jgi:hypothetical protein
MTSMLTFVMFYEVLGLLAPLAPFVRIHWGHVTMSKCCMYDIDDSKTCAHLISITIKEAQSILQKTIT